MQRGETPERLTECHTDADVRKEMGIVQLRDEVKTKVRIVFNFDIVEPNRRLG